MTPSISAAQYPLRVVVEKDPLRVEAVANCGKAVPLWIEFTKCRGGLVMAFTPMRPARILGHDLLDRTEVGFELHAAVLVNGDVAGVSSVGSR